MTLKEFLAAPPESPECQRPAGAETEWLFLCEYRIYGHFLQLIQKSYLGDLRGGVIIEITAGMHLVEARAMTFEQGRRISRIRIRPAGVECELGEKIDEIHSGEGGLAACDVDGLRRTLDEDERGFRFWHKDLMQETYEEAGVAYWTRGNMEFPYFEGGFGEDYYPVHSLLEGQRAAGLEIAYIEPGTPYPCQTRW